MIPAAGVQSVISDKKTMPPCGVATNLQQYRHEILVQPEATPTTIEVVDRNGEEILINVNLHQDADIRMDFIDQMREHERLPRVAWTEDLFHRKD
eukprot:293254-Karenia_brevis.AAC.1